MRILIAIFALLWSIAANAQTGTMPGSRPMLGSVANLDRFNQQIYGGGTPFSTCALGSQGAPLANCIAPSTFTPNCGYGPVQYLENNGAFTFSTPTGITGASCIILLYNGASAGTVTFSGFTIGGNTGAALTTNSGDQFSISLWRIVTSAASVSAFSIFAHQ
jgi:hypothetical protein